MFFQVEQNIVLPNAIHHFSGKVEELLLTLNLRVLELRSCHNKPCCHLQLLFSVLDYEQYNNSCVKTSKELQDLTVSRLVDISKVCY